MKCKQCAEQMGLIDEDKVKAFTDNAYECKECGIIASFRIDNKTNKILREYWSDEYGKCIRAFSRLYIGVKQPEILPNDLICIPSGIGEEYDIFKTFKEYDEIWFNNYCYESYYATTEVLDVLEYITKIYRKQNDDYIMIWKSEG